MDDSDARTRRTPVTLDDVARAAGVSPSTVSRTLNNKTARVGGETAARIRAVARELGYTTNLAAQTMARGHSGVVGFVVDALPHDYQNPVAVGVLAAAARADRLVLVGETGSQDPARARELVTRFRGQRPQAIVIAGRKPPGAPGMHEFFAELARYEEEGGRVVFIGQQHTPFDSVVVDDHHAGHEMARTLLDLGYREFSVISHAGHADSVGPRRTAGFVAGLAEAGVELPPDRVLVHDFSHDGGYRAAGELLRRRNGTEAVFAVNDAVAIGAMVRLREAGVRVGPDIALAGCDDIVALRDIDPGLTTMSLPWDEVGERAFALAADDTPREPRTVVLTGHPVVRTSTPGTGPGRPRTPAQAPSRPLQ